MLFDAFKAVSRYNGRTNVNVVVLFTVFTNVSQSASTLLYDFSIVNAFSIGKLLQRFASIVLLAVAFG